MTYRFLRDAWMVFDEPLETTLGFKFIGNPIMESGTFEIEETQIVKKILQKVNVFINIGANIGYYCCIALSQNKYVIAFEPLSLNLRYLLKNIQANNWESQIEVNPIALSNKKTGIIEIYGGGTNASLVKGWAGTPEQFVTLVPVSTLDNVLTYKIQNQKSLILVDIEGAEYLMLEGASLILTMTPKPIWMVEISIKENQPKGLKLNPNLYATFNMFWINGYEAWTATKDCRLISKDEIKAVESTGIDTLNTYNFIFIEKGMKSNFF